MTEPLVQITRRRQRRRKNLTAAEKSELCQQCGRCCMAMTFEGGELDEEAYDQIRWMELHGLRIDYYRRRGVVSWFYTMATPCSQLRNDEGRYSCAIYETRPQMCRDYEGWSSGPTGVPDCLWLEPDDEA
jgi:Fe-S-cluster containining protein